MRSLFFALFLLIFQILSVQAQSDKTVSLIVKYSPDNETDNLERVVKFDFRNGDLISKKDLFTVDVEKAGNISGIYLNRYVLTSNWTVYDWKPDDEKFFDITTEGFVDRKSIPANERANQGILKLFSPDGKKSVNLSTTLDQLKINIEGQKDLVINEKFAATVSSKSSITPILPIRWIDNERILTQKKNGSLVIITLDAIVTPFLEIPCSGDDFPRLRTTKAGKLIYNCSGTEFRIDLENRRYEKIKNDLDYDFSLQTIGREEVYYFQDEEIGRGGWDSQTIEGYLAVTFGETKDGFGYVGDIDTIKVWDKFTRNWKIFKVDGSDAEILGWIEK